MTPVETWPIAKLTTTTAISMMFIGSRSWLQRHRPHRRRRLAGDLVRTEPGQPLCRLRAGQAGVGIRPRRRDDVQRITCVGREYVGLRGGVGSVGHGCVVASSEPYSSRSASPVTIVPACRPSMPPRPEKSWCRLARMFRVRYVVAVLVGLAVGVAAGWVSGRGFESSHQAATTRAHAGHVSARAPHRHRPARTATHLARSPRKPYLVPRAAAGAAADRAVPVRQRHLAATGRVPASRASAGGSERTRSLGLSFAGQPFRLVGQPPGQS